MRAVFWAAAGAVYRRHRVKRIRRGRQCPQAYSARQVDLVLGGIRARMRNAIKDVIVARAKRYTSIRSCMRQGMYSLPVLHRAHPGPAMRRIHPWLIKNGGKNLRFPAPISLAAYAQCLCAQGDRGQWRRSYLRGILSLDQIDFSSDVNRVISNKVDVVFNNRDSAGRRSVLQATLRSRVPENGDGSPVSTTTRTRSASISRLKSKDFASCLDYFKALVPEDPVSAKNSGELRQAVSRTFLFAAGSAATGTYRGLKLCGKRRQGSGQA